MRGSPPAVAGRRWGREEVCGPLAGLFGFGGLCAVYGVMIFHALNFYGRRPPVRPEPRTSARIEDFGVSNAVAIALGGFVHNGDARRTLGRIREGRAEAEALVEQAESSMVPEGLPSQTMRSRLGDARGARPLRQSARGRF